MSKSRRSLVLVVLSLLGALLVVGAPAPRVEAVPTTALPTQWIARQYTEILGRAPTTQEWQYWIGYYQAASSCTAANLLAVTTYLAGTATSPDPAALPPSQSTAFASLYPASTLIDKATRLSAVVRAVSAHDVNDNDWTAYFVPYLHSTASDAWATAVNSAGSLAVAIAGPANICSATSPNAGFVYMRPVDLRAKVMGEFPTLSPPLTASRTQAELQAALTTAASGATVAARTVTLKQGEVIRIGGAPAGNQTVSIPAGVTVTSEAMPAYTEPAPGSPPAGLAYARMGRVVPYTTPSSTYPQPADGWTCVGYVCQNVGMVALGSGAHLQQVWVDGQGVGDNNSKVAVVETDGSAAANASTVYDDGTSVVASRVSQPSRDGVGIRARGNSAGFPCVNEKITGNLITGYNTLSQFDRSGQALWADGIDVFCESAVVSSNSLVDLTDVAILVAGSYNRSQSAVVTQRSEVRNNFILSAGLDGHVALGADAMGECRADRDGWFVPCLDQSTPRDLTGARLHDNTFWSGPRTSVDIGLMVGGGALWGDHQILNAGPDATHPTLTGAAFDHNTTGTASARVNIGIDIHDMVKATVSANTMTFSLVDGNPGQTWNKCPQVQVAVGATEAASLTTNVALPAASNASRGCLIGEPPAAGPEPVRIKADGSGFEGAVSLRPFSVWGGDLPYPQPITTMVDDFRDVRRMGANTIRLLLETEDLVNAPSCGGCAPTINATALNQLGDVATAADQTGIYLDITGIGIDSHHGPVNMTETNPFHSWYDDLGSSGADEQLRWQAQTVFWGAVANKLRTHNSTLLYDLVNEPTFAPTPTTPATTWCFSNNPLPSDTSCWNQNPVKSLTDPTNPTITRTPQAVVSAWFGGMRNAIRATDTTHPISVGVISAINPTLTGCAGLYGSAAIGATGAELTLPHFYPNAAGEADQARQTVECKLPNKPQIIEETYSQGDPVTLEKYITDTSAVSAGYLGHFIGGTPSQLTVQLQTAAYPSPYLAIWFWRDWDIFFLRNNLIHSPAGQGIMPY